MIIIVMLELFSYSSEHNVAVKNYLLNHLAPKFKDKHSPKRLNGLS